MLVSMEDINSSSREISKIIKVIDDIGIAGVPSITDVGTYKVEITAYGSSNSYTLTDYIIVKEYEE